MNYSQDTINAIINSGDETFYVLNGERFRINYRNMLNAFRAYWNRTELAYSYKTNYIPRLCSIICEEGGCAEVVSEMELCLARSIGVDETDIYFNGPYKPRNVIQDFLIKGGHLNVDHMEEVRIVKCIAKKHPQKTIKIGVRCALDIGQEKPSRFGFDYNNGSLQNAITELECEPNIKVMGLHVHLPYRDLETFKARVKALSDVLGGLHKRTWDYISMGGGYMGDIPEEVRDKGKYYPDYHDYAETVAGGLGRYFKESRMEPTLIIEPGSALVADVMQLVTTVVAIKETRGKKYVALSGSSYDINPSVKSIRRPITVLHAKKGQQQEVVDADMVGYTCIENDCLYRGFNGGIAIGDRIVFGNVGSYSITMKPPFIMPEHAIVEICAEGSIKTIRKKQLADEIMHSRWV